MKLVSEKELRELLIASEHLKRLDAFGVNIDQYEALCANNDFSKDFRDWKEKDLDRELDRYSSYTPTFDDNYNFD